jgi:hypothetical protein
MCTLATSSLLFSAQIRVLRSLNVKGVTFDRIPLPLGCNNRKKKLSKVLAFYNSKLSPCTVPLGDKLKPDHEVRYPEDEGLYVGNRLTVTNRNKNKLERRLLAGGDR